jgi:hypothetical protein
MATFTITTNESINTPPYQTGILYLNISNGSEYVFTENDFTINTIPVYKDSENDALLKIKIKYIDVSNLGGLYLNNILVEENDEILVSDINLNLLVYKSSLSQNSLYNDDFSFDVADVGSTLYGNLEGKININIESEENLPPSEVGDGEATIDYNEVLVFTRAMFTTATTPPYSDPEGDAALLLKITSLPTNGKLIYNDILVSINQIISFNNIDLGLLTFEPDGLVLIADIDDFTFEIADAGSGIFVA